MIRSVSGESQAPSIRDPSDARRFASSIIRARPQDEVFDARSVLSEFPELGQYDSAVLDLVYEEFSRRAEAGEELDSQEFADRFPQFRSAILEHIRAHQLLERCFGDKTAEWPEAGDAVLGCQLEEEIGRGAFSRVFLARQTALGNRRVVVKFCPSGEHEAQLLGKLEHENIVQVHSVETDDVRRLNAIVMPFHGRATLRDVIDYSSGGGAVPATPERLTEAVARIGANDGTADKVESIGVGSYADAIGRIMLDVARGLAHAHRKGVLHADIKPTNVLVTASLRAKLLDFNLSHDSTALTNMTGGTVPYMAPEQLVVLAQRGEPKPTPEADVYAFGATFFECLAGHSPYGKIPAGLDRTMLADWLLRRRQDNWSTLEEVAPHVPPPVRSLVGRCLSLSPRERPAGFDEVVSVLAREQKPAIRLWRRMQRNRVKVVLAAGLAVAALATAFVMHALADPAHVALRKKARIEIAAGNYPRAAQLLDNAEALMPPDVSTEFKVGFWLERGQVLLQSPETFDSAFKDFERIIAVDERHAAAHAFLAYSYLGELIWDEDTRVYESQVTKALDEFQQALQCGLDTPELRYDIALCRSRIQNESADGIAELRALSQDETVPENVVASALLAAVRSDMQLRDNLHTQSGEFERQRTENIRALLDQVQGCSKVYVVASFACLLLAMDQQGAGNGSGYAESVDLARNCAHQAVKHDASPDEIARMRAIFQQARIDASVLTLQPGEKIIESSPAPAAVLNPLSSVPTTMEP